MIDTSQHLAAFVAETPADAIPERVIARAKVNLIDTLASAAGGFPTANAQQMRAAGRAFFGEGEAPVWFSAERLHGAAALLANCAAASALDIDDGHRGAAGHPGAAIIPAVLQEAARRPIAGRDVLAAIVLGYEVALRVAASRPPGTVKTFSSGRWTGYGVAAAIGWLRKLRPEAVAHAITIAGAESPENLPAGSYRRLSSVKGSSPWSTLAAMVAVERAMAGADGPLDSLDREAMFSPALITEDLGTRWEIERTYLKPYASCRYTHASIDAVLALTGGSPPRTEDIGGLRVELFPEAFTIANERAPETLEGAQFSIPFCLALATLRGAAAFRPLRDASLADPEVMRLSQRVEMATGEDFLRSFPAAVPSRVRLLVRGEALERTVIHPLGDVDNPLPAAEISRKLRELARGAPALDPARLEEAVIGLEETGPSALLAALSGDL